MAVTQHADAVDRVLQILFPLLGIAESSDEATYLRQLLLDHPEIDTVPKLQAYLADASPNNSPAEHETVARALTADAHARSHIHAQESPRRKQMRENLFRELNDQRALTPEETAARLKYSFHPLQPPT